MTQIGLMLEGQNGLNWEHWKRILALAEEAGYQCVFRSDHFTNTRDPDLDSLELWTSLTYAASHTSKIEFGPLVTPVTFRHPSMNARYASAIDDLSGGRLVFGMGAGWMEREHQKFGIPFYDFPTRFDMLEDALEVVTRLWNSDDPVTYSGQHFSLEDATLLPRPQREHIPLLIGGNGPKRTLPLIVRFNAQEWNAVFIEPTVYRERAQRLDELLAEVGRDPKSVKRSLMTQVRYVENADEKPANLLVGQGQELVDQIGAWVELGVERFMLQWLDLDNTDGIAAMAEDILPHFHQT